METVDSSDEMHPAPPGGVLSSLQLSDTVNTAEVDSLTGELRGVDVISATGTVTTDTNSSTSIESIGTDTAWWLGIATVLFVLMSLTFLHPRRSSLTENLTVLTASTGCAFPVLRNTYPPLCLCLCLLRASTERDRAWQGSQARFHERVSQPLWYLTDRGFEVQNANTTDLEGARHQPRGEIIRILVMVYSEGGAGYFRTAHRQTWISQIRNRTLVNRRGVQYQVDVIFVLGTSANEVRADLLEPVLREEQQLLGDLLILPGYLEVRNHSMHTCTIECCW